MFCSMERSNSTTMQSKLGTSGAIYIDMATFIISAVIIMFVNTKEQNFVKKKAENIAAV